MSLSAHIPPHIGKSLKLSASPEMRVGVVLLLTVMYLHVAHYPLAMETRNHHRHLPPPPHTGGGGRPWQRAALDRLSGCHFILRLDTVLPEWSLRIQCAVQIHCITFCPQPDTHLGELVLRLKLNACARPPLPYYTEQWYLSSRRGSTANQPV
jgi:hypothetical protein